MILPCLLALLACSGGEPRGDAFVSSCTVLVEPNAGRADDVYTITARSVAAGAALPGTLLFELTSPSAEKTRVFLTLVPGATEVSYRFHERESPGEPAPVPLAKGMWQVLAEDEAHVCSATATFTVS